MAAPDELRCKLCDTNICTLIIVLKTMFAIVFTNHCSRRWKSVSYKRREQQRRQKNNILFYKVITIIPALAHLFFTGELYEYSSYSMVISIVAVVVYLLVFWYVTEIREEFTVTSHTWHSGLEREAYPYYKICMPEYTKFIVIVVLFAQIVAPWLVRHEFAWFLVTGLHFLSCYCFLDGDFAALFPKHLNGNNELVYEIQTD